MTRKSKIILGILFLGLLCIAAYYMMDKGEAPVKKEKAPDRLYTVKRGDLSIGVLLSGNVNTKVKHKMALRAPFNTKLIWIVDENTKVKEGEIIAKFETEDLQFKIDDLRLQLENYKKELIIAEEERRIQISSNEAEIRTSEDKVTEAQDAFNKYWKLEGPKLRDTQQMNVTESNRTYLEAKAKYEDAEDTYKSTVFGTEDDEQKALAKVTDAQKQMQKQLTTYNNAILDWKIFKRYTNPNKLTELENKLEQAKLDLNKTQIKTASQLVQKENSIFKIESNKKKTERDLEKHLTYMPQMQLIAPADGIVVYGDPDNRRWTTPDIRVGMDIRRNEVLMTIPDMSKLVVDLDLPEQYRTRVKTGAKAVITPDAMPDIKIEGILSSIATIPVNLVFWDSTSPKIYRSTIDFETDNQKIVSGTSVKVEIITEVVKDVIMIPIEAVFEEGNKFFVYVRKTGAPHVVDVEIGQANDNYVEIRKGLAEGDIIYLYRPFQKKTDNN